MLRIRIFFQKTFLVENEFYFSKVRHFCCRCDLFENILSNALVFLNTDKCLKRIKICLFPASFGDLMHSLARIDIK